MNDFVDIAHLVAVDDHETNILRVSSGHTEISLLVTSTMIGWCLTACLTRLDSTTA